MHWVSLSSDMTTAPRDLQLSLPLHEANGRAITDGLLQGEVSVGHDGGDIC
eukprot:m.358731 g.358731  ORF g.358731 m.358731 type:complete len:51 (+) comp28034_c0_seq2:9304-9456(+)